MNPRAHPLHLEIKRLGGIAPLGPIVVAVHVIVRLIIVIVPGKSGGNLQTDEGQRQNHRKNFCRGKTKVERGEVLGHKGLTE